MRWLSRAPRAMVEHVRARLARQICAQKASQRLLPLIALSANMGEAFAESLVGPGDDRSLAMQPSKAVPNSLTRWCATASSRPRRERRSAGAW